MFFCWILYNNARSGQVFKAMGARDFGWEHVVVWFQARRRHITYRTNEYGEVARSVPASSNLMVSWLKLAAKISWFLSPDYFCGVIWRVAYSRRGPPLLMNSRPISGKRFMTCYTAWLMVSLSSSKSVSLRGGGGGGYLLHSIFKKRTVYVSYLISKISVKC
jgi:hypothetical protein